MKKKLSFTAALAVGAVAAIALAGCSASDSQPPRSSADNNPDGGSGAKASSVIEQEVDEQMGKKAEQPGNGSDTKKAAPKDSGSETNTPPNGSGNKTDTPAEGSGFK